MQSVISTLYKVGIDNIVFSKYNGVCYICLLHGFKFLPLKCLLYKFLYRKMNIVLNGHLSRSIGTNVGVPRIFILGPALFLMFIKDFPDGISSQLIICADDKSICSFRDSKSDQSDTVKLEDDLKNDLQSVC